MDKQLDQKQRPEAVVCANCGGNPRAAESCKACAGAGIGLQSDDGFLVWLAPVDETAAGIRRLRLKTNAIINLAALSITVICFGLFLWQVATLGIWQEITTVEFWRNNYWFQSFLYLGIIIGSFFVFRISEFRSQSKELPGWLPRKHKTSASIVKAAKDVALYFNEAGMEIVESAYKTAKELQLIEITPEMLFAAALSSQSGGIFMARLGMQFDKVKTPLIKLLMEAQMGKPPIALSRESKRALLAAYAMADEKNRQHVGPMEIFLQAFLESAKLQDELDRLGFPMDHVKHAAEWIMLQDRMAEDQRRFFALAKLKPKGALDRAMTALQTPLLDHFSEDLTVKARNGWLSPMIGHEDVMEGVMRGFESGQLGVVISGETGSGKAAVIEELARRMVEENVPEILFDKRLVSVNLAQVVAAGDSGLAAERLLSMLHEVGVSGNIVLALYGIEALAGRATGPMDLAETFASELDKRYFYCIATVTPGAWTEYLERRSLGQKMVKVDLPPADKEQTIRVLMAKSGSAEVKNNVYLSYAALEKAAELALRFVHDVAAPQSALNIMREAAVLARQKRGERTFVGADDIAQVVKQKTGIPVETVSGEESHKLLNLEEQMHGRVIGQDEAVVAVARAIRRARAEMRESKRPIANFLFLGPTGVGKTETAKTLAQEYFGDENAMVRLDMSEYQDKTSIDRMIGRPGDERGGLLTEAVRKKPFTIVLLDEIEKAHPDILNLFLQVMDDGRLTDGVGRTVDFTNTVVIMTSNAGTAFIQSAVSEGQSIERIKTALLERELKGIFRPEFLNRFDGVIVFKPLGRDEVVQIAWLMINKLAKQLEAKSIYFKADDAAVEALADAGFDSLYGARPLRRVLQDRVETQIADLLLKNEVERHDTIELNGDGTVTVSHPSS